MLRRSDWLSAARSVRESPPDSLIAFSHRNAMSFMHPSTLRSAVLARIIFSGSRPVERGRWQALAEELPPDQTSDEPARRTQIRCAHIGLEDREQRG